MGLFENFPYTNFHELNLDWLLENIKKALDQYEEMEDWKTATEAQYDALEQYVTNYFANLDVDQAVTDRLNELVTNGTITTLIRQVITQYITDSQVWGFNPFYYYALDDGSYTGTDTASWLQSITTDGVYTYLFFDIPNNLGNVRVDKYRNSDKVRVATATIAGGYHANGADYYDGTIYLATLDDSTILEIDPDTLTLSASHSFSGYGFRAVSVDNDGTVYGATGNTWYPLDMVNNTVDTNNAHALNGAQVGTWQSGIIRDGYVYEACSTPRCVIKFDLDSGEPVHAYPVDRYVDIYHVGEIEAVAEDRSGHFFVGSASAYPFARYRFACVLQVSTQGVPATSVYQGATALSYGTVSVDSYNNKGITTGTAADPFPCLAMALMAVNSPTLQTLRTNKIDMLADCNEAFYMRNGTIELAGNNHVLGSVYGINCDLEIHDVDIRHTATNNQPNQRSVQLTNSRTFLHNMSVSTSITGSSTSIQLSGGSSQLYGITLNDGINTITAYRHLFKADPSTTAYITEV